MKKPESDEQRIPVRRANARLALCLALAMAGACGEADDQGQEQERADDAPLFVNPPEFELDPKALEAFRTIPAPPYETDPAAVAVAEPAEEADQKIRNGVTGTYNDGFLNSLVSITVPPSKGCTAQVINNHMLLTAAHCIPISDPGGFSKSFEIMVHFTKRDGSRVMLTAVNARAFASKPTNGHDIALFFLPDGIPTCFNTVAWCKANRADIPVNGQFQYYGSEPFALHSNYVYGGYGTVDGSTGGGVLRWGPASVTDFLRTSNGLLLFTTWKTTGPQTRVCQGDSGSPLIPLGTPYTPKPSAGRNFYNGVLRGGSSCTASTGNGFYTMLEGDDALWTVLSLTYLFPGLFSCGAVANLPAGTLAFECGNG